MPKHDTPRDSNDGAYETTELREGVPLDYVSEKIQSCIAMIVETHQLVREDVADTPFPSPPYPPQETYGTVRFHVLKQLEFALDNALTAFTALSNMLSLANEADIRKRLLAMQYKEVLAWCERVWEAGKTSDRLDRKDREP